MARFFRRLLMWLVLAVLVVAGGLAWWVSQPLSLSGDRIEVSVPEGASMRTAAQRAVQAGVRAPSRLLYAYFRLFGRDTVIQPGEYEVHRGMRVQDLLAKLARGDRIMEQVTLIEGWTFTQFRQALAQAAGLRHETADWSNEKIMKTVQREGVAPEGRFFPDTYRYAKNSSDLGVLRHAMAEMDRRLAQAWRARADGLPLKSADEALILASLIEKETGASVDRPEVAGVFINRLRINMPLQTDPSVIYGAGDGYDGRLRRSHLRTDTPFNTYTRRGLPPTPIAMPGEASLMAAVQPAKTQSLYFVARGDGSSHFSENLRDHNRAVDKYIRGKR